MKSAFVVEFLGLPGSGKSYIADLIKGELRARGVRAISPGATVTRRPACIRVPLKFILALLFTALHPIRGWKAVDKIRRMRQASPGDYASALMNLLFVLGVYYRYRRRPVVLLFDQGFAQGLVTILYAADNRIRHGLLSWLPRPDMEVEVEASRELVAQRLGARGRPEGEARQSRVEAGGEVALQAALSRTVAAITTVKLTPWYWEIQAIEHVSGESSGPESEARLAAHIDEIVDRIASAWETRDGDWRR